VWLQKMSMCQKKSVKCKAFARKEKKCSWTTLADEIKNVRIINEKQAVGVRKQYF